MSNSSDESSHSSSETSGSEHSSSDQSTVDQGGASNGKLIKTLWTKEEMVALLPLKLRWRKTKSKDKEARNEILEEGLRVLETLKPGRNMIELRGKLKRWVGKKTLATGGDKAPTMRSLVDYYMKDEIEGRLREEKGLEEGEEMVFGIGERSTMSSRVQREIMEGPGRERDRKMLEKKLAEWTVMGFPRDVQRRKAETEATKSVQTFVEERYRRTGARCIVLLAFRNSKNTVCTGIYDFNDHLGAEDKDFLGEHKSLREKMDKAWAAWAEENMTDDEGSDDEKEVRKPRRTKVTTKKEKIKFRYSKEGEPLLPHGCLEGTLDDKKSLVRSFLTAHYAIAKGVTYPKGTCTVPWREVGNAEDGECYNREYAPSGLKIGDPSKMNTEQIHACLEKWKAAQDNDEVAFRFKRWYDRKSGKWVDGLSPQPRDDSDVESSGDEDGERAKKSKGCSGGQGKTDKGKGKEKGDTEKDEMEGKKRGRDRAKEKTTSGKAEAAGKKKEGRRDKKRKSKEKAQASEDSGKPVGGGDLQEPVMIPGGPNDNALGFMGVGHPSNQDVEMEVDTEEIPIDPQLKGPYGQPGRIHQSNEHDPVLVEKIVQVIGGGGSSSTSSVDPALIEAVVRKLQQEPATEARETGDGGPVERKEKPVKKRGQPDVAKSLQTRRQAKEAEQSGEALRRGKKRDRSGEDLEGSPVPVKKSKVVNTEEPTKKKGDGVNGGVKPKPKPVKKGERQVYKDEDELFMKRRSKKTC